MQDTTSFPDNVGKGWLLTRHIEVENQPFGLITIFIFGWTCTLAKFSETLSHG